MSQASATIIAALIGFVGGLVVAAFTFRQKADELFLAGLQYLKGGSQERNLGIAAIELSLSSRRHRKVAAPMLVGIVSYLLLESGQGDAYHEGENLRRIMALLSEPETQQVLKEENRESLHQVLETKLSKIDEPKGLRIDEPQIKSWMEKLRRP